MLRKNQVWTQLSAKIQRRAFTSTTGRFTLDPSLSTTPTSSFSSSSNILLQNLRFSFTTINNHNYHHQHFLKNNLCSETYNTNNKATCWNCNQQSPFLVCGSCRSIQPVDHSINYFGIFGLEKKYEIKDDDENNLSKKYKDWQKLLHPDLVHSKSQKEREFAAEQSARVTNAYRTLANPRLRAIYILKLEGVDVNEEETVSEPQLLAEIMEIREAVEEAPDSKALTGIQSRMTEKLLQWSNSFANAFQNRNFEDAIACIRRMTYYDRVNEEIVKRL